jgi:hypothetical protein
MKLPLNDMPNWFWIALVIAGLYCLAVAGWGIWLAASPR